MTRSVHRECEGCVIEPRKGKRCGWTSLSKVRGRNRGAAVARRRGPTGVEERSIRAIGLPRNLGDPVFSIQGYRIGHPGVKQQALVHGSGARAHGSERRAQEWYYRAKETKRGGTGDGKSQLSNSTEEAGEQTRPDPVEGRGEPVIRSRWRERCRRR